MSDYDGEYDFDFLNEDQVKIVKQYGGWERFLTSHGLKPWEPADITQGLDILEKMIEHDNKK